METAELQERQHAWRWPLDAMACSSGRCCLQLEWDPQLIRYFGGLGVLGAAAGGNPDDHGAIEHELGLFFPKCTWGVSIWLAISFLSGMQLDFWTVSSIPW